MFPLIGFIFINVLPSIIKGLIQDEPMPKELYECFYNQTSGLDIKNVTAYSVQIHCLNYHLTSTYRERFYQDLDPSVLNWIQTLDKALHKRKHKRKALRRRREIRTLSDEERRAFFNAVVALKEDTTVRPNMYDAIAGLHNAQAIQAAHFGPGFLGWHRYLIYLFEEALRTKDPTVTLPYWDSTFDFNMDKEDPMNSVMWSDLFLGNGNGLVTSGPFANWRTNNGFLTRNIGSPGSLMTPDGIKSVLSQLFHKDITQPTAKSVNDLEGQHNNIHNWIGGDMDGLLTSTFDPVFFLHHCFVDYIWERFRIQQFEKGIKPQNDYPNTTPAHWPWVPMVNLGRLRNVDGYHNAFTQFVYQYEDSPTCPNCGGSPYIECDVTRQVCVSKTFREFQMRRLHSNIGSAFGAQSASLMTNWDNVFRTNTRKGKTNTIEKFSANMINPRTNINSRSVKKAKCNPKQKKGIQVANNTRVTSVGNMNVNPFIATPILTPDEIDESLIISAMLPWTNLEFSYDLQSLFKKCASSTRNIQSKVETHTGMKKHRGNSIKTNKNPSHYEKPIQKNSANSKTSYSDVRNMIINASGDTTTRSKSGFIDIAIQNNFVLDGVPDVTNWAFTAVRIIYKRPPGTSCNSKLVKGGIIVEGKDFYAQEHYPNLQKHVSTGNPATYPKPIRSGSGASKVFVESNGLTYQGKHIDYAIIDERQPISEAVTYVAFKNPKLGASKAYISAYDANGRICQPRCLIPGTNPPQYKICSGVVFVSDSYPKMYGDTYGDAVMNRYSFDNSHCPSNKDKEIFLTFYCDYSNEWPWTSYPHN